VRGLRAGSILAPARRGGHWKTVVGGTTTAGEADTSDLKLGTAMTVFCLGLISVLSGLMLAFGSRSS
jgi:hypothetical protein